MGWFRRRIKDGVEGQAQIVSSSSPHGSNGHAALKMCTINLVITAPGIPAFSAEHTQLCRTARWPYAGTVLPVTVSRSDPSRYEIDFDAIPDHRETARQRAEQQAAMLRGEAPASGVPGAAGMFGAGAQIQFVGGTPADLPPDKRARLEQVLGVDLDGDGVVGAAPPPPPTSPPPPPPPPSPPPPPPAR